MAKRTKAPSKTEKVKAILRKAAPTAIRASILAVAVLLCLGTINRRVAGAEQRGCAKGVTMFVEEVIGGSINNQEQLEKFCKEVTSK